MPLPKIAIIGAGPSGLTLARILQINNIPCTVFEREASAHLREQGGSLDLHAESGILALHEANLYKEYQSHVRNESQDFVLADRFGKTYFSHKDTDTGRPEIDRKALRQILLDSLPAESIRWGHKLERVEEGGALHFTHGSESGFDLIVGADGAWSKVRPMVCHLQPFYSGVTGVEMRLRNLETTDPKLSEMVGKGSLFVFGEDDGLSMMLQRMGDKSVRLYTFMSKPESYAKDKGLDPEDPNHIRAVLLQEYRHWAPELKRFIDLCGNDIDLRVLHMLPVGIRWPHRPGFTLIGDAAHLMTVFAGEGVNMAMLDAMELGKSIVKHPDDLAKAVEEHKEKIFPRAREMQQLTWDFKLDWFGPGALAKFKRWMESWTQEENS
ncbi:putative zeaxanthin epoxidase [Ilyonectria robusta]|uniref:putative zeaxanthin epoxidase n=1 Tax=Ilyonectria robusta TaxID=1079257 RepID=UPI001E8D7393|nr:putative zeaxanthin epoxidase [Ilyonectria robusta]KAH8648839.1 putative zeaxanthin epoxidase [Ilyonectria robusta]